MYVSRFESRGERVALENQRLFPGMKTAPTRAGFEGGPSARKEFVMTKDPVCGMQVDEKKSPTSTYKGQQYAFCNKECKTAFDQNPTQYAQSSQQTSRAGNP